MSGSNILLDTNALGLFLQDKEFAKKYEKQIEYISISIITYIEYLSNPLLTDSQKNTFEEFTNYINIIHLEKSSTVIIHKAIGLRKKYKLKLPDAIIVATAMANNLILLSNDGAFQKVFDLKLLFIQKNWKTNGK